MKKEIFCSNIDFVVEFLEMIRNESGQIDFLKIDLLDQHINVKKTALEEEYEAHMREKKEKKKNKKKHKKEKKDYKDYDNDDDQQHSQQMQ